MYIVVGCVVFLSVYVYINRFLSVYVYGGVSKCVCVCVCVADRKEVLSLEKLEAQLKACLRCMSFSKAKVGSFLQAT